MLEKIGKNIGKIFLGIIAIGLFIFGYQCGNNNNITSKNDSKTIVDTFTIHTTDTIKPEPKILWYPSKPKIIIDTVTKPIYLDSSDCNRIYVYEDTIRTKDYDLYSEDYTNITLKYESERQAILRGSKVGGLDARERARRDIMSGGLTQLMNDDFAKQVGTYNKTWQSLVAGDKANSLAEFATSTYAALKDFGMNLSVGFAEVAGAAFSGGISVSEAFTQLKNVFLNSIGDLLIQVGSAAIKLGLFKDGIQAALLAGGISGGPAIAIGLAAVAAGTAIKSFASQDAKNSKVIPTGMGTSPSVSSKASGSTYAYGGSSYSTQSMKLSIDLTGSITATQTGYAINKSLETTLRVTGR